MEGRELQLHHREPLRARKAAVSAAIAARGAASPLQKNGAKKVVGPFIQGKREEYRLEKSLQGGLFGGIYEARGVSSGRRFAVKVVHFSEVINNHKNDSLEFCEVPLSEISFLDIMRGHDHVMEVEDHFEDEHCSYIVFPLAIGGDLLEALKLRPRGFEEGQVQFLISQVARGLSALHSKGLAMQDVSLENMLIHILDDGQYQIKICDPGQAIVFETDASGKELPVEFHGFVGKSFRPPEVHSKRSYLASKVDAWCLGWSTFYLLAAQPLFITADPAQEDADWLLFRDGDVSRIFKEKGVQCSKQCMDFILCLMKLEPESRMSIDEALQHEWLSAKYICPMYGASQVTPCEQQLRLVAELRSPSPEPSPNEVPIQKACDSIAPRPCGTPGCGGGVRVSRGRRACSRGLSPSSVGTQVQHHGAAPFGHIVMPVWRGGPPSRSDSGNRVSEPPKQQAGGSRGSRQGPAVGDALWYGGSPSAPPRAVTPRPAPPPRATSPILQSHICGPNYSSPTPMRRPEPSAAVVFASRVPAPLNIGSGFCGQLGPRVQKSPGRSPSPMPFNAGQVQVLPMRGHQAYCMRGASPQPQGRARSPTPMAARPASPQPPGRSISPTPLVGRHNGVLEVRRCVSPVHVRTVPIAPDTGQGQGGGVVGHRFAWSPTPPSPQLLTGRPASPMPKPRVVAASRSLPHWVAGH